MTGGLHDNELIIIAARPSMGKSAFAANIADYVAMEVGKAVLFVSLEMSKAELALVTNTILTATTLTNTTRV